MISEFLNRITTALDTNGIPYMSTGSLASSMYGIPSKMQHDLLDYPYLEHWVESLDLRRQWDAARKKAS